MFIYFPILGTMLLVNHKQSIILNLEGQCHSIFLFYLLQTHPGIYQLRLMTVNPKPDRSYSSFRRAPKNIKNTSLTHTVALDDILIHHDEHGNCSLF